MVYYACNIDCNRASLVSKFRKINQHMRFTILSLVRYLTMSRNFLLVLYAKNSNFEIFESTLYIKSGRMPLKKKVSASIWSHWVCLWGTFSCCVHVLTSHYVVPSLDRIRLMNVWLLLFLKLSNGSLIASPTPLYKSILSRTSPPDTGSTLPCSLAPKPLPLQPVKW